MDKQAIMDLWQTCFHDSDTFVQLYFDRVYRPENTLYEEEEGQLIAMLQTVPYDLSFYGAVLSCAYVAGVATLPQYRNGGRMRRLMSDAFRSMQQRNIPVSALIPAEKWLFGYYASMGYAPVFSYHLRSYAPDTLPPVSDGFHLADFTADQQFDYWQKQQRHRQIYIQHSRSDFDTICLDLVSDGGRVYTSANRTGQLSALAFVVPDEGRVLVKECTADSDDSRAALLSEISALYPRMRIEVVEPLSPGDTATPLGMIRIVSVSDVLCRAAQLSPQWQGSIVVSDPVLPENNGCFRIRDGRCERMAISANVDWETDISGLARFLFGGKFIPAGKEYEAPYMNLMLN